MGRVLRGKDGKARRRDGDGRHPTQDANGAARAALVAALHNWQIDAMNEDLVEAFLAGAGEMPMKDAEIDALCERLDAAVGKAPR